MNKKEKPKVFISYAWGTQEYQMKVLSFATALMNDGVEVLLDKWQLEAGNDMLDFMERSVKDPTVTNVLILLDENYANKANNREGGVGTETQIISPQVYASVDQSKFIPIVFERDADGNNCKPVYLNSRYYYDLSNSRTYNNQYHILIKELYGVKPYKKPEIGERPAWVDEELTVSIKKVLEYDSLKNSISDLISEKVLEYYLLRFKERIIDYSRIDNPETGVDFLNHYVKYKDIRDCFLLLLDRSVNCENRRAIIGDFFENTANEINKLKGPGNELASVLIHELFIYVVALLFKQHCYSDLRYLWGRSYFPVYHYIDNPVKSFGYFHSLHKRTCLDKAVCRRDGINYYSGTAKQWLLTVNYDYCSMEEFIGADLLCFNYSVYGNDYLDDYRWFPITYKYLNEANTLFLIAKGLRSREKLAQYSQLFNYDSAEEFISKAYEVETMISKGDLQGYRFPNALEAAPLLGDIIKASEMGTVN